MSMYAMLFGQNPLADVLLSILGLTKAQVGRFRDCFVAAEGKEIHVYTRNGGGNRECWQDSDDETCTCTGCTMTNVIPKHPLYLGDSDDDFDCTYATIRYKVPSFAAEFCESIAANNPQYDPAERWEKMLNALKEADPKDADAQRALKVGQEILKPIFMQIDKAKAE